MKTLTIGYIGNGKSTNRYHLPYVLQRKDTFQVKTIYNPRIPSKVWAAIPGILYTDRLEELLDDPQIDLIVVCTRHHLHFSYAKQVLEHGKHCLVEKPFTETSAQARELFSLAKEKGLYLSAYQNRRYDSDFLTVQQILHSGILGDPLELEIHFDYYRPEIPESVHEFKPAESMLYGHGCHTLDQVISCFGKPDDVHYDVRQLLGPGHMSDYFDLDLYYGNSKVSVKSSYFRIKPRPSFVLYGKKGMFLKEKKDRQEDHLKLFYMPGQEGFGLDLPEDYGTLIYMDSQGAYHEEKVPSVPGDYGRVYDGIYASIVQGAPQIIPPEQTLLQMQLLEEGVRHLR